MISKEKMTSIFYHIPKRNINAFHKQISQIHHQISTLIARAPREYPTPIIIKMGKSHYLLNETKTLYSGHIDPHSSAFTSKYKSKTDLNDLLKHRIYHSYQITSKTFGTQYIKTNKITKTNLNSNKWYDIIEEKNLAYTICKSKEYTGYKSQRNTITIKKTAKIHIGQTLWTTIFMLLTQTRHIYKYIITLYFH